MIKVFFGRVVAAGNAIAAIIAFVLLHPDVVCALDGEVDVDGRPVELLAQMLGGLLEGAELGKFRVGLRIRIGLQHFLGAGVGFLERSGVIDFDGLVHGLGIAQLARPTRVVEYARLSPQGHIGIHQGCPAQAAADKNVNVRVNVKIVEPRSRAELGDLRRMRLHLGDSFRRTVGVFTGLEFAAALQDADLLYRPAPVATQRSRRRNQSR